MTNFFEDNDNLSALEAQYEAQKIAFAPIIFQVAKSLRDLGILEILTKHKSGLSIKDISLHVDVSEYGVRVLCESGLSANILKFNEQKYSLTKVGYFLNSDKMTKANMNYNHFVNYLGLYNLKESIEQQKPVGLGVFGEYETIYPALSSLPSEAKKAWFEFDHLYSDSGFGEAIEILKEHSPKKVLDIGGNSGKFALALSQNAPQVEVCIFDLPQQIALAKQNIYEKNLTNVSFYEANILHVGSIPSGFDVIWMSQFLDCFSDTQVVQILKKVANSLSNGAKIFIMEPFWDRQNNKTAAFCVINTSPYFTAMANGYSKMFKWEDFELSLSEAGLEVECIKDNIGLCQSLIICKKAYN